MRDPATLPDLPDVKYGRLGGVPCAHGSLTTNQRYMLALVLVIAAAARIYRIGASGFWMDEFCSVECATGRGLAHVTLPDSVLLFHPPLLTSPIGQKRWWAIWPSMSLDNHPPLYFMLLRAWLNIFGDSDTAARSLSIIPSLLAIVLLFDAVRWMHGPAAALWAAALMAIAMPQVHYAQEARNYSLWVAGGTAALAATARIEILGASLRRAAALTTAVLAMAMTHYYSAAPMVALGVYAVLVMRGRARRDVLFALGIAVVLFAATWGPFMLAQRHRISANNDWQSEPAAGHIARTFARVAALPLRWLVEPASGFVKAAQLSSLAYFLPVFFVRRNPKVLLWYLWIACPAAIVGTIDLCRGTQQSDLVRYTLIAGPGLFALLGALATHARPWGAALPAAIALLCAVGLHRAYPSEREWPELADALKSFVSADDAIVFASAGRGDYYAGALYLGVSHYAGALPAPIALLRTTASPDLVQQLRGRRSAWLVAGSSAITPADLLPGAAVLDAGAFPEIGAVYHVAFPK